MVAMSGAQNWPEADEGARLLFRTCSDEGPRLVGCCRCAFSGSVCGRG